MDLCWWSRFCGGLFLDIKRKIPWYPSDFYEGFHIQSISAVLFIYLGCITNAITFGGLLGDATDNYQVHSGIFRLTQDLTLWLKLNAIMFYWTVYEWASEQALSITLQKTHFLLSIFTLFFRSKVWKFFLMPFKCHYIFWECIYNAQYKLRCL